MSTQATCPFQNEINRLNASNHMDGTRERRLLRNGSQRSSSSFIVQCSRLNQQHSIPGHFQPSSSVSSSRELRDTTLVTQATKKSLEHMGVSFAVQSSTAQPTSQKALIFAKTNEKGPDGLKPRNTSCNVPWRWSRIHKGIKRRKVIYLISKKHKDRNKHLKFMNANILQGQVISSEGTSEEEVEQLSQEACDFSFKSAFHDRGKTFLKSGLNQKYQPKVFQDIAGHDVIIKAISKAVEKKKIAPLYLFYGPCGTGKTSAARIFAMGLNCESARQIKPCWSCRGCSRSLYVMELWSGSRMDGFERIKTLIHNTSFTQALPGLKVLIIEECHLLTTEAWDELLAIIEGPYTSNVVIILVTIDVNNVPKNISSKCQKFCFSKLKDKDITLKLAKIIAGENIVIEREALNMIITKSEGSLREAENILDQLALLGSRISSSMVQQLVGLVPHDKLTGLLSTAVSGDTINTIRFTKELIATGVEPQALVSQLVSLLTEVLSGTVVADVSSLAGSSRDERTLRSRSEFTNIQSHRLCHALKILVNTEKQIRSSTDQTSDIFAALFQITSEDVSSRPSTAKETMPKSGDIRQRLSCGCSSTGHNSITKAAEHFNMDRVEPITIVGRINNMQTCREKNSEEKPKKAHIGDFEKLWQDVLDGVQNKDMKEFLCNQVKLASLCVSRANAIVHLMFKNFEDKMAAQFFEESMSKALEDAIGCPVTINMSLEPVALGIFEELTNHHVISDQQQRTPCLRDTATCHTTAQESPSLSDSLRLMNLENSTSSQQHKRMLEGHKTNAVQSHQTTPFPELCNQKYKADIYADAERDTLERPLLDAAHSKPRDRWLSLSSIPQSDVSVEPYSQDILFDKANKKGESKTRKKQKFPKAFSETKGHHFRDNKVHARSNQSWSCTNILCLKNTKG